LLKLESASGQTANLMEVIDSGGNLVGGLTNKGSFFSYGGGNQPTNLAIGLNALRDNTFGRYSVAIGTNALFRQTTPSSNTAIGFGALAFTTTGGGNMAIGRAAGYNNTTGSDNLAFGSYTFFNRTNAVQNIAIGNGALSDGTTGSRNVAIGYRAASANAGNDNIAIGKDALRLSSSTSNSTIAIGSLTSPKQDGGSNEIIIGNGLTGNGSNTATIGDDSVTELHVGGNGAGVVLKSPDGTQYKITVSNSGVLTTTAI